MPNQTAARCVVTALFVLAAPFTLAVTVQLPADRDTMLASNSDTLSNGSGTYICVGRTGEPATRRGLIRFDPSAAGIPAGSTVTDATLSLYINPPSISNTATIDLHRLTQDWGEGGSNAPAGECKGRTAQTDDATWRYRFYDPDNPASSPQWTTLGADFAIGISASSVVGPDEGFYEWSHAQLVADVQAWVDDVSANHGWLLKRSVESGSGNAVRFASRQGNSSERPSLTIVYTPPALDGACCFPEQICQELSAADCGNGGGTFQGSGTDCTPNECPPDPIGACCAASGDCSDVSAATCATGGGVYQGDETTCATAECPIDLVPFVDPLPLPAVAQPIAGTPGGAATYSIAMREIQQFLHRDLPPTTLWGYGDGPSGATFPGPTIEAGSHEPVVVDWVNDLRDTSVGGDPPPYRTDHYLPVPGTPDDPACSIHGAENTPKSVVHVHGAHVEARFDGYPEDTYLPGSQATYTYANRQLPGTLWYHDHSLGITRLNVYMGLAGFYIIRDAFEESLGLPSCTDTATPDTCFDVPIVIQDRSFHPDGSLRYPAEWQDHFFGNKIVVNGKVWPYFDVKQGKYRLRLTNGCTSRTLRLSLDRLDLAGEQDMPFVQIGTEGGLFELADTRDQITLAPAERADVVIDFELLPPGTEVVLRNDAPAPYPGSPGQGVVPNVMKFVVQDATGHTDALPTTLRPLEVLDELDAVQTREFHLEKQGDACGDIWTINGLHWDDITEYPQLGTTEIWEFVNPGGMMHPMHMHLVMFQVLDRRPFGGGAVVPPESNEIGWKDTARAEAGMITRVIARFEDYPGLFAYHCHILEHEDHEMMRQFLAVDTVRLSLTGNTLAWPQQPGAVSYDLVRGDLGALRESGGNYALSSVTETCVDNDVGATSTTDAAVPSPGDGYWYLIRSLDAAGVKGTYDTGASSQVDMRDAEVAASGNDCSTGIRRGSRHQTCTGDCDRPNSIR